MHTPTATTSSEGQKELLFGHPVGLYTLFFAEMWERFSYYGMRALLVLYMIKGFLGDERQRGVRRLRRVHGARVHDAVHRRHARRSPARRPACGGARRSADGGRPPHDDDRSCRGRSIWRSALLIAGNGFFKPNISTMVGQLYPAGSPKRDGGFTIFYMGINLGAAMSPLAVRLHRRDLRLALRLRPGDDRHADRRRGLRGADAPHAASDPRRRARDRDLAAVSPEQSLQPRDQRLRRRCRSSRRASSRSSRSVAAACRTVQVGAPADAAGRATVAGVCGCRSSRCRSFMLLVQRNADRRSGCCRSSVGRPSPG